MRTIVITGWVLGAALLVVACDEKSSGSGGTTPAQSASANAATVPASSGSGSANAEPGKTDKEKTAKTEGPTEGPKEHPARVKAMEEAFAAHDAKKIANLYADDAVIKTAGVPDVKGREAIQKEAEKMFGVFKDAKITHGRIWEKDKHTVVVESVFTGTNSGDAPEMGIPKATNKPVGVVGAEWMEVGDNGLIKEEHRYHDMATSVGQLNPPDKKNPVRAVVTEPPNGTEKYMATTAGEVKAEEKAAEKDKKEEKKEGKVAEKKAEKAEKTTVDLAKVVEWEKQEIKVENDWLAALNNNKLEDGYKLIGNDIFFVDYTQPTDIKGKKAFKDMIGMYMTAFPDMKAKMTTSFGDREFVVAEFEYTGTQKGALGPIKPTGKTVDMHQLEVDEFKDGKIVKGWAWGNNMEMLTQLGVMPDKPGAAPAPSGAPSAAPSAKPAK